jgi:hypothetical protein
MALPLNERLQALFLDTVKKPQLILEVEGWPTLSSIPTQKFPKYGDPELYYGMPGLFYGTPINDPSVLPYIDLSRSTNQISQQLLTDKGGFTSATNFEIAIIDKDQLISQYVSPDFIIDETLSKKAKIYLCLEGAAHPQQSILFFSGIVIDITTNAGMVKLNVASGEKLKSQDLFTKVSTDTSAIVNPGDTTINVITTNGFLLPADGSTFMTYVRIDDEVIGYTSFTDTQLLGCARGQLGTAAATHQSGTNVESFYRLQGNLRDLALKLMLGGYSGPYISDLSIVAFNTYASITASNSIFISNFNIDQTLGITAQDTLTITGSTSNDGSYPVQSFTNTDTGAYIVVTGTINSEPAAGTVSITSRYNVLPAGASLGMTPDQVDIAQFERIYNQFSSQFFSYDFYIKDGVNGTDFINQQILYPSGGYAIPRKAKTSMGLTIPPLAQSGTVKLDEEYIVGASKIAVRRSVSKNFYNAVVYRYDPLATEDRYTRGKIRQSADSTNRIKISNKPLVVTADGVRSTGNFDFIFNTQARRFLDRYQYAAESFETEVLFGIGFGIEIGDTVIFDGRNLNVTDSSTGNRTFEPRLFEVQNKSYSLTGKTVKLTLVDTVYSLGVRYGVVSPASIVGIGSTTSRVVLQEGYSDDLFNSLPATKWLNYLNEKVLVHSKDWTYSEETTISGFDPTNAAVVLVDPPLSTAPTSGLIFDTIKYPNNAIMSDSAIIKAQHVFTTNQILVTSGVSLTEFNVALLDAADIRIGATVYIHNMDYSIESNKVEVQAVVGTLVTVNASLGIVPAAGQFIEFFDFPDGGSPYVAL